jgi:uncharacterized protein involved in oxidation of intracellular sulfur
MNSTLTNLTRRYPKIILALTLLLAVGAVMQFAWSRAEATQKPARMKLGIVVYSGDAEVVWNAFRFGNFALNQGDQVKVFLLAKGVEAESLDNDKFKVTDMMKDFVKQGGQILACGTCLNFRHAQGSKLCPISTMQDMYDIVKESDKVVTF